MIKATSLLLGLLSVTYLYSAASRADTAADDQAFFDSHLGKLITVTAKRIEAPAVSKITSATFYDVTLLLGDSGLNDFKMKVARVGDEIAQVSTSSLSSDMSGLQKLIKPEFKIKTMDDAKVFQDALDAIYPINTEFGDDDLKAKAITQNGKDWTFVRGKSSDTKKAFIVATDDGGTITAIKYSEDVK